MSHPFFKPTPRTPMVMRFLLLAVPQLFLGVLAVGLATAPVMVPLFGLNAVLGKAKDGSLKGLSKLDSAFSVVANDVLQGMHRFQAYSKDVIPVYNHVVKSAKLQYDELARHWSPTQMLQKLQKLEMVRKKSTALFVSLYDTAEEWMADLLQLVDTSSAADTDGISKSEVFNMVLDAKYLFAKIKPRLGDLVNLAKKGADVLMSAYDPITRPLHRILNALESGPVSMHPLKAKPHDANGIFSNAIGAVLTESVFFVESLLTTLPAQVPRIVGTSMRLSRTVSDNVDNIVQFAVALFNERTSILKDTWINAIKVGEKAAPLVLNSARKLLQEPMRRKVMDAAVSVYSNMEPVMEDAAQFVHFMTGYTREFEFVVRDAFDHGSELLMNTTSKLVRAIQKNPDVMEKLFERIFVTLQSPVELIGSIVERRDTSHVSEMHDFFGSVVSALGKSQASIFTALETSWISKKSDVEKMAKSAVLFLSNMSPMMLNTLVSLTKVR